MTTITTDLNSKILANISLIAGEYQVYIGQNVQTGEITAENFENAGRLVHFKNAVEDFLNSLNLRGFSINTRYNPYEVSISWRR